MTHPYRTLPPSSFWRRSADAWENGDFTGLYAPRFAIDRSTRIATAGSCFAQHIGRNFRERGYAYLDMEPAPSLLPEAQHQRFGYGIFSCRYGNIYTSRQLLQLAQRVQGKRRPDAVWEQDGRFYDGLRPSLEPDGFGSREELEIARASHIAAVTKMFEEVDLFVFTLGLTEVWIDRADDTAFPTCPGTVAGTFDADRHRFHNLRFDEVIGDMRRFIAWATARKPDLKVLLTVSPVPLAATASSRHVVAATTYSKSVLRAVAGQLVEEFDNVDYFPSFEIITSTLTRGEYYQPDRRNIRDDGVSSVMGCFFTALGDTATAPVPIRSARAQQEAADREMIAAVQVICDEEKLDPGIAA